MLYRSPSAAQLKAVKDRLKKSGAQMASMSGLKSSRRWREHTDENKPLGLPPANLFMLSALMCLPPKYIELVLATMRETGAVIDLDADSDSQEQVGEQEQ